MRVIPPRAMQTGAHPPNAHVTKLFWAEHVEQVKTEFESVKSLGSAAAEEWIKGLEIRGKQVLVDASRWEKWAGVGGIAQLRMPNVAAKTNVSAPAPYTPIASLPNKPSSSIIQQAVKQQLQMSSKNEQHGPTLSQEANLPQPHTPAQQKRTKEEATQLKAQRRADIERRAMLLDPPLTANVLAHIPSFQAALQIITPLDDNAWELLKPRLLVQREEAEQRVKQTSTNAQVLRERPGKKETEKKPSREPREVTDEEWDEIQGSVRARISEYADEIIEGWNNSAKIKRKTCPQFAADVLLYVRKRFYAEVAKNTAALIAAGKDPIVEPPEGPWTQKLTLENMKWVFDVKVRPHTEPMRKELFLCNACIGGNGMLKYFGFEGVLQHYAAKHTIALSLGNVVVHWRAEWPEMPPFCPDPRMKEKVYYEKDSSNAQQTKDSPLQQAYSGFQAGLPTGYLPPVYGAEVAPLPHYNSAPHIQMQMPLMIPYDQAGVHAYGAPYSAQSYHNTGIYSTYPPQFPSTMTYGSHGLSNDYTAPGPPAPGHLDYEPYSSHNDHSGATSLTLPQQTQPDTITRSTQLAWSKIGYNKKIPPPVRALAVIRHTAKTFEDTHHEPMSLGMFIDATAKSRKLRMFRSLNGVACRACDGEVFHLPKLANHFKAVHIDLPRNQGLAPVDWLTGMIRLPEEERLAGLAGILREDVAAYSLVREAIPWAFEQAFIDKFVSKPPGTKSNDALSTQEPKQLLTRPAASVLDYQLKEERPRTTVAQIDLKGRQSDHAIATVQPQPGTSPIVTSSAAQLQDDSEQDIAPLRPASEVYGRKARLASAVQPRPAGPVEIDVSRSDDYSPSEVENFRKSASGRGQGETRGKPEHGLAAHSPSHPVRPRHWRDEQSSDHRDVREQRYSGTELAEQRDRSASVGNRPRDYHAPVTTCANVAPSYVEVREPSVVQKHQAEEEEEEEEVVYVDESGREIGRGRRARNTLPREPIYGVPGEQGLGGHDHPSSPWYGNHRPVRYRERSPRARYTQPGYYYEPEPPATSHRAYFQLPDIRPPTEYPTEAYELIEVRRADGDYFVRRPVRRDERPYYVYETHPPLRERSVYPTQQYAESPSGYGFDSRGNPAGPRLAARPAHDDYDPQYPASTIGASSTYRGNQ